MLRRRRKPKVVWLPKDVGSTIENSNIIALEITSAGGAIDDGRITTITPVVIDFPGTPIGGIDTLSDIENSGYRLRRIVGKCFFGIRGKAADNGDAATWLCAAAFIVLKVDSSGVPLDSTLTAYDIFAVDNDDSPWIWKREWILQSSIDITDPSVHATQYPRSNTAYGSVQDGPHIDQKTARLIQQNERLFFVTTVTNIDVGDGQKTNVFDVFCTPRVLASMRTSSGNRRNASR